MGATLPHPKLYALTRRLLERGRAGQPGELATGEVPVSDYRCETRCAREKALFRRLPLVVASEYELADPGACLAVSVGDESVLLIRGPDGVVRGFRNACRHRGTQLLPPGQSCARKAVVCPYHGWTYDLTGRLTHVPHEDSFAGRLAGREALAPARVDTRHGLVWLTLAPTSEALSDLLAPIDGELAALEMGKMIVYRRVEREVAGNWKLIVDAFLDGYHLRQLHRDTVYRFFVDAWADADLVGRHIRAVAARRPLVELRDRRDRPLSDADELLELVTPAYLIFPNTILILHPDFVSVLTSTPLAAGRSRFVHWMLIPSPPRSRAEEEHRAKSFALIDEGVFHNEDLFAVEAMQRGLAVTSDATVLFGSHEHSATWFHRLVDEALGEAPSAPREVS